jgi:phenylalanyl-tRNA synthetase beta chain
MAEIGGGKIAKGKIVVSNIKPSEVKIKVSLAYLKKVLGVTVAPAKIKSILTSLGCKVFGTKDLIVTPPTWRQDLRLAADIAEEVGRIYGYDKLGEQYLAGDLKPPKIAEELVVADKMRDAMARMGYNEVLSYSFYSEREAQAAGWEHLELQNPMSPKLRFMRTTVATHLLELAREVQRRGEEAKIFEIGKVFFPDAGGFPKQEWHLAAVLVKKQPADKNFMEMRGVSEKIWLDSVVNVVDGIAVFEVNLTEIAPNFSDRAHFEPIPEFPSITRDLALVFDEDKKWDEIRKVIKAEGGALLVSIHAFDVYRGKELEGKKSIAFRMTFSAPDRTLKTEEVDKLIEKIKSALGAQFNARAR